MEYCYLYIIEKDWGIPYEITLGTGAFKSMFPGFDGVSASIKFKKETFDEVVGYVEVFHYTRSRGWNGEGMNLNPGVGNARICVGW